MTVPEIALSSLKLTGKIGDGGEGEVFGIENKPGDVLKLFKSTVRNELSEVGLRSTIGLLDSMTPTDRAYIQSRSAWPSTIVRDSGAFVGFLMPKLSDDYFVLHGQRGNPGPGPNDWNKLTFRRDWMPNPNLESSSPKLWYPNKQNVTSLSDGDKQLRRNLLELLLDISKIFALLHRYNIVVGDVSGRNLMWSAKSGNTAMLIDCDGCRLENSVGVTRAKQSPDWFDQNLTGFTNIQSDVYKLAVAIYRGYFSDGIGMPRNLLVQPTTKTDRKILEYANRGVSNANRPSAQEWTKVLEEAISDSENDGRPKITWFRKKPPPPPLPPPDDDGRPIIKW